MKFEVRSRKWPSAWLYATAVQLTMAPSSAAVGVHVIVALVALKLLALPGCALPNELVALPLFDAFQAAVGNDVEVCVFIQVGALVPALNLLNESAGGGLPPDDTHCSDASRPSMKSPPFPFGTGLSDGVPGGAAEFTVLKALPLKASAHH